MENYKVTLLQNKNKEFEELYDTANVQRPMTLEEWNVAVGMYENFVSTFSDLVNNCSSIDTLANKFEHTNSCRVRYSNEDVLDLEFYTGSDSVDYICVTMTIYSGSIIHISHSFDVAVHGQDYEYECMQADMEKHVLQTKEQVLYDISGGTLNENQLFNVKFPTNEYFSPRNFSDLVEIANKLYTLSGKDDNKHYFTKYDKSGIIEIMNKYNITVQYMR